MTLETFSLKFTVFALCNWFNFFLGFTLTFFTCSILDILQGNFKPDYYLKHIQKDLRLAISMGDTANHPTPMAAAANEVN